MPLRRIFLLGAATLASVAALVAIGAVLRGDFGETEGKIFATLAATFVAGSALTAGVALLARDASQPLGYAAIVLAVLGYVLWTEEIWVQHDDESYWKVLGIVLAWTLATLLITTNRLMLSAPRLVRTLYPATAAASALAALTVTVMLLREEGTGWQLFAVLLILALLGEVLTPILERYTESREAPRERLLATAAGVDVLAVRGESRTVHVAGQRFSLQTDEGVVIRSAH